MPIGGPSTGPLTPRHKSRRRASNTLSFSSLDRGCAVMIIPRACTVPYLLNRYFFQSAVWPIASAGAFVTMRNTPGALTLPFRHTLKKNRF